MSAMSIISDPHRGQIRGLSLSASQPAAAYEIDLVDLRDQSCPRGAAGTRGYGLCHGVTPIGRRLQVMRVFPSLWSQARHMRQEVPACLATGGVQTVVVNVAYTPRRGSRRLLRSQLPPEG